MARAILPIHILSSEKDGISGELAFTAVTADGLFIPYRYAINATDISNYAGLVSAGKFRASSPTLPNSDTTRKYGFQLPRTEKLVLLVKGVALAEVITISGSSEYGVAKKAITVPAGAGKIYEISLRDFGLHIDGHGQLTIGGEATDGATVGLALVAR